MLLFGDPVLPGRIWKRIRVDSETGCWIWIGCVRNGYGHIQIDGQSQATHRLLYTLEFGPIPAHRHIDHKCRVTNCCNPSHLHAVTPGEHVRLTHERIAKLGRVAPAKSGPSLVPIMPGYKDIKPWFRGQSKSTPEERAKYDQLVEQIKSRKSRGRDKKPRRRRKRTARKIWATIQERIASRAASKGR
jgi:hypothetical protein